MVYCLLIIVKLLLSQIYKYKDEINIYIFILYFQK